MKRRWSEDDDFLLADLLGTRRTLLVAQRLGRTVAAVWSRASQLGISPYREDGRYTASELARALDVPPNTVLRWCRNGLLPAEKIGGRRSGGMWRVSWDGDVPLTLRTPRRGSTLSSNYAVWSGSSSSPVRRLETGDQRRHNATA